jgi:hypothetical protein
MPVGTFGSTFERSFVIIAMPLTIRPVCQQRCVRPPGRGTPPKSSFLRWPSHPGRDDPDNLLRVRNRIRGSTERTGASHAQIRFYRRRSLHRGVLRGLDRLNQRSRRSSRELCLHCSDANDGRFSQFARRALRRLLGHLSKLAFRTVTRVGVPDVPASSSNEGRDHKSAAVPGALSARYAANG